MSLKCIIVDDEEPSRIVLSLFLSKYCPGVEVVGEAENADKAHALITGTNPDIVFLDISMPGENGFALLEKYEPEQRFEVIFVTAHDEFAIKAIKNNAADYLIKPLSITEMKEAVARATQRIKTRKELAAYKPVMVQEKPLQLNEKIAVPVKDGYLYVDRHDLVRCEAAGGYTWMYFKTRERIMVTRTLGEFEDILPASEFVRVHHHHLINLHHVTQYNHGQGGQVVMTDKTVIEVSRRKKNDFLEKLGIKT